MTFKEDKVLNFLEIFDESKTQIRAFEGCQHLELLQDQTQANVYLTYSHWQSPEALECYRNSDLFRSTWAKTKVLFAEKPMAFSSLRIEEIIL